MTKVPQDTSAEEPDGGNLQVRLRRGPGSGDRPGLLNSAFPFGPTLGDEHCALEQMRGRRSREKKRLRARASDPVRQHAMIAEAAYFCAERRGFAPGHELEDWLQAEAQLVCSVGQPVRRS